MSPGRATRRQTYVALLRGINLGARNKVSMADLRTLFASLGGEDVTTYVQSGNVVFKTRARDPDDLSDDGYGRSKLSNAFIEQQLGVAGTTRNWRTVARLTELV